VLRRRRASARSSRASNGCNASVKGEIARLIQANQARQLALARAATLRNNSQAQAQALALQQTAIGASASVGSASVAPPSQYTGVVAIAMRYLGVQYVWGGSSPSGFDCSGLVAYVYAQVGVSLPHYTGALWNVGVPVSRSDLQPGDLVFFDGARPRRDLHRWQLVHPRPAHRRRREDQLDLRLVRRHVCRRPPRHRLIS